MHGATIKRLPFGDIWRRIQHRIICKFSSISNQQKIKAPQRCNLKSYQKWHLNDPHCLTNTHKCRDHYAPSYPSKSLYLQKKEKHFTSRVYESTASKFVYSANIQKKKNLASSLEICGEERNKFGNCFWRSINCIFFWCFAAIYFMSFPFFSD